MQPNTHFSSASYQSWKLTQSGSPLSCSPPAFTQASPMMNWDNGKPNPRYWVLKLIRDNFVPGDKIVQTKSFSMNHPVYAEGFVNAEGKRKVLLVNLRNNDVDVRIPGSKGGSEQFVDEVTGENPPRTESLGNETVSLKGFSVTVVNLP